MHYDMLEENHIVEDSKEDLIQNIFRICDFKEDKIQLIDHTIATDAKRILFIKLGAIGDVIRTIVELLSMLLIIISSGVMMVALGQMQFLET